MSAVPGATKYNRIPMRQRIQLFWCGVGMIGAGYQLVKLTMGRVQPRREEHMYEMLREKYGEELPESLLKTLLASKEAQETMTLQNILDTPTPGELCGALQHELDPRRIADLRSKNGN